MNTEHLEPCPFCGGQAEYIEDMHCVGIIDAVACTGCNAAVLSVSQTADKTAKAALITNWNTRKDVK